MPTADELYEEAKCFLCYGMTQAQALKLALLRRKVLELDPDADVTPATLLLNASCYNCYANGSVYDLLELALLAIIAATACPPAGETDGLIWGPSPETVDEIDSIGGNETLTSFTNSFFTTSAFTEFSLGNPRFVTNSVDFSPDSVLTSLTFRLLETVGTNFNFDTNVLTSFSAPLLQSVGGLIVFSNSANLTALSFPSLLTVGTDIVTATNVLTSFSAPLLQTAGDELDFSGSAALVNLTLPSLTSVGNQIFVDGGAIEVLSLPVLATYPPLGITADASLLTLNLPACVDDGAGQLNGDIGNMSGLVTANLDSLAATTGDFAFDSCPSLASLNANSLVTVGNDITFNTNSITSLLFPALVTVTANVTCISNAMLTSFSAPLWIPTDGTFIAFTGNALDIPSVELILRRCVLAAVTTCTIDLSGGTNAGTASLSAQGQADVATLGAQVTMNP